MFSASSDRFRVLSLPLFSKYPSVYAISDLSPRIPQGHWGPLCVPIYSHALKWAAKGRNAHIRRDHRSCCHGSPSSHPALESVGQSGYLRH